MSPDDWTTLRFEATRLFTPSTPIGAAELFAGRQQQMLTLINTIGEPGRHAILYGEPGVGKTSMSQIIQFLIPTKRSNVVFIREPAYSNDSFSSLWLRLFSQIELTLEQEGKTSRHALSEIYASGVAQGDVKRALYLSFSLNDIPIIVIDEYNVIKDTNVPAEMAEAIKSLSDDGVNVTIIVVGVSDSVTDLVRGHQSIIRCSEEVLMPRMAKNETKELLEKRIAKLGMKMDGNAKWKIINLSNGLPAFAHSLGRGAVLNAIDSRRMVINEQGNLCVA
jgi:Cdc6-like AAA superfamily ATPase